MEAGAAFRTLHPAIASEEVATHAKRKAVSLVGAEEVSFLQLHHVDRGRVAVLVVQLALDLVYVGHPGVLAVLGHAVDLLQPLHLAVAQQGVLRKVKFGHWTCKAKKNYC
jgi:hypothetical protein